MGWSREFAEPIPLPGGRELVTLCDAAEYITGLIEALMLVADLGGPTMFARVGVVRALNRHVERVFNPDRKDTHWGKRKLKRDQ